MRADAVRRYGRFSWPLVIRGALTQRCFRAIATFRLAHRWPILRPLHGIACWLACLDLPSKTLIGPGLQITHGFGLVVSSGARIGSNVTLFHGVTLGRADSITETRRASGYPVIEDEVWIGPHATIVGAVRIGQGSRIAAGAFVTENIPPRSLVVGNPARIVRENCQPDILRRA